MHVNLLMRNILYHERAQMQMPCLREIMPGRLRTVSGRHAVLRLATWAILIRRPRLVI